MRRKRNSLLLAGSLLAGTLLLAACGAKPPAPPAAKPEAAKTARPAPAKPAAIQARTSSVGPAGPARADIGLWRDPFKALLADKPAATAKSGASRAPQLDALPLQRYDSGQYKLLGVIYDLDKPAALVLDPEGKSHVVRIGGRLGLNRGVIRQIGRRGVEVQESVTGDDGKRRLVRIKLQLAGKGL